MIIVFNEKVGKIASIIHSLNYANNLDLLIDKLKNENINIGIDIKEDFCFAKTKLKEKAPEDLDFFFGKESMIWKAFIHNEKFWTCNNVQEFLNQVINLSEIQIKERLYIKLNRDKEQKLNHKAEIVIKDNKKFFYYIKVRMSTNFFTTCYSICLPLVILKMFTTSLNFATQKVYHKAV